MLTSLDQDLGGLHVVRRVGHAMGEVTDICRAKDELAAQLGEVTGLEGDTLRAHLDEVLGDRESTAERAVTDV